jgi:hypothetical protein
MSTEQIVKLSDQKKGWEKLITTPEWGQLMAVLQAQVDVFQQRILFTPLQRLEDAMPQEYMKGQMEGRLSLTNTVETIIEGLENELNSLRKQNEHEN